MVATLQSLQIPCTLAAVPFICDGAARSLEAQNLLPLEPEDVKHLTRSLKSGLLEVAQHGYSHQNRISHGRPSEFKGMLFSGQLEAIRRGKTHLEKLIERPVTTFVPPWNSFDANTFRALESSQFACLSAAPGASFHSQRLSIIPHTCVLRTMETAVKQAVHSGDPSPLVVVAFHSFDFVESNEEPGWISLPQMMRLMKQLQNDFNLAFSTLEQAASSRPEYSASHARLWRSNFTWQNRLPPALRSRESELCYPSSQRLRTLRCAAVLQLYAMSLAISLGFMALSCITASYFDASRLLSSCFVAATLIAQISVVARSVKRSNFSYRAIILLSSLIGLTIGFVPSLLNVS